MAEKEVTSAEISFKEAQLKFGKVKPILLNTAEVVNKLEKDSIQIIKKLHQPSSGMIDTFEALCILFERKPRIADGKEDYWPEAVALLSDLHFQKNILNFKAESIKPETIQKLQKYVTNNREEKRKTAAASFYAAAALYDWVCATYYFWIVYQEILPKRLATTKAAKKYESTKKNFNMTKKNLSQIESRIQEFQESLKVVEEEAKSFKSKVDENKTS